MVRLVAWSFGLPQPHVFVARRLMSGVTVPLELEVARVAARGAYVGPRVLGIPNQLRHTASGRRLAPGVPGSIVSQRQ